MGDLISRSALDAEMQKAQESLESNSDHAWEMNRGHHKGLAWARRLCADAPAVDAAPVVHARWVSIPIPSRYGGCVVECSKCYNRGNRNFSFCPSCGAKMDVKEE